MKKRFTLLLMLAAFATLNAQIVITEIMYNPPESGGDVNEYIELHNAGDASVDMEGFHFTQGVKDTISGVILPAGAFLLIAKDSVVLNTNFGLNALQWTDGALSNGGEDIVLVNALGEVQDSVDYDDGGGWPESADGDGFSLVLCDFSANNADPANWQAAATSTGVIINDKEVFANPGAISECQANALVRFIAIGEDVNEDVGSISVGVEYPAGDFVPWEARISLDTENSTATNNMDFSYHGDTLLLTSFQELDTFWFEIPITDDMLAEETETFVLTMAGVNIEAHTAFNTYTVNIADNDSTTPGYTIGEVTTVDENGVADSIGIDCIIQGTVYGVNMNGGGLQFTVIDDNNDGIGLYLNSGDLGYTVQEGDEVIISGVVGQFRGLTQISPESITKVSEGNSLIAPSSVTTLDESTESQLVEIENLTIMDPSDWSNSGGGFNVMVTDGVNEFAMRIDADVNIFGTDAPTTAFNLIGIGGQYDNSDPLTDGYQIFPRYLDDISLIQATKDPLPTDIKIYPNPVSDLLNVNSNESIDEVIIRNITGELIFTQKNVTGIKSFDMGQLPSGVYTLSILRSGQTWTQKITKL